MGGICARHEQRPVSGALFFNMAGLAGMKNGTWIPHGNMRYKNNKNGYFFY
jgi:hypothetical protein